MRQRARRPALAAANLLGIAAFTWPFLLPALVRSAQAHGADALWIMVGLLGLLGVLLFCELGRGGMGPKTVALVGVLGALMVALRLPGFVGGFSAMFVIVLVAGHSFGPGFGFVLGAVGTFASGLFVGGIGPWLPFQMVAVGWVGVGAGLLPRPARWGVRIAGLAAYGAAAAFAFGAVMNLWFWPFVAGSGAVGWQPAAGAGANLHRYLVFYLATSAGWDAFGAVGNAVAVILLGRPLLGALDRAARRMHVDTRSQGEAFFGTTQVAGVTPTASPSFQGEDAMRPSGGGSSPPSASRSGCESRCTAVCGDGLARRARRARRSWSRRSRRH